jgi:hypothetical protein
MRCGGVAPRARSPRGWFLPPTLLLLFAALAQARALNQRSYAALHKIESGPGWSIEIGQN